MSGQLRFLGSYPSALSIAGSDSGAGAGIQSDLKTFAAHGVYGTSAITALTAQNTQGVQAVWPCAAEVVGAQITSVMTDFLISAIKLGMLANEAIVTEVAARLACHDVPAIVLDPILLSSSGRHLLEPGAVQALTQSLFPLVHLLTPNLPEAEYLLGRDIRSENAMASAAKALAQMGAKHVLIKGGHAQQAADDCLYDQATDTVIWLRQPRIASTNTHGTGCTLSAAITARLALGETMPVAVHQAKRYLTQALLWATEYAPAMRPHSPQSVRHGPLVHIPPYPRLFE